MWFINLFVCVCVSEREREFEPVYCAFDVLPVFRSLCFHTWRGCVFGYIVHMCMQCGCATSFSRG